MDQLTQVEQFANQLREEVKQGIYGVSGQGRIPTTATLAKRWHISRNTVYQVLQLLQSEGIIRAKGTSLVVNYPMFVLDGLTKNFEAFLRGLGHSVGMENLVVPSVEAMPPDVAALFGQSVGVHETLVHRMRKQSADDQPLRIAENWYPVALAGQFVEQMRADEHMDVLDAIKQAHGVYIVRVKDVIAARIPTSQEARWLKTVRTEPIVEIRRSNFAANGTPVMFNRIIHLAPNFTFTYEYTKDYWA